VADSHPKLAPLRRVCVFCGSRAGARPVYLEFARTLGEMLAQRRIGVVYGGASVGLMGALADGALAHGGEVIGVIPQSLVDREIAHGGLSELHVVATMHERKARMAELADAFIAMPGGLGTFEELFETITWQTLGIHRKPIGLLDVCGYFRCVQSALEHGVVEGFLDRQQLAAIVMEREPAPLLDRLQRTAVPAPATGVRLTREES
jgi:uncharacterized protein (TIGR00730 family)